MSERGSAGPAEAGPRRLWLIAVAFGLVSAGVIAVVATLATRTSGSSDAGPPVDVVVIGDSITEFSADTLGDRLSERWTVWIDGQAGATVEDQLPAAREGATHDPRQVVVNLGTNDVTRLDDPEVSVANVRRMLDLYPDAVCLHVVTVTEGIVLGGVSRQAEAADFDRRLRAMAQEDPRVSVIEWDAALEATEEADGVAPADLLHDTIHPTRRGEELLADTYAAALAACPAG